MTITGKRFAAGAAAWVLTAGLLSGCAVPAAESAASASASAVSALSSIQSASAESDFGASDLAEEPVEKSEVVDSGAAAAMADELLQGLQAEQPADGTEVPFGDVAADSYYYQPVLWALEQGITSGVSETEFGPDELCTRAQTVTFLCRLAGTPAEDVSELPFTDVSAESPYAPAIGWAVEQGITSGVSETEFGTDEIVTRLQTVTFLWRMAGMPEAAGETAAFTDTDSPAVAWAVEQGITSGVSETEFGPDEYCSRAQVVTFLYRYASAAGLVPAVSGLETSVSAGDDEITLNIGPAFVGDTTQEALSASALEKGYSSAVLNEDGSATLVMREVVYENLLGTLRSSIEESMDMMPGSDAYPNVTTVYANDSFTIFTMQTTVTTKDEAAKISVEELFLFNQVFSAYSGTEPGEVLVIIANDETGAILREARSSDK